MSWPWTWNFLHNWYVFNCKSFRASWDATSSSTATSRSAATKDVTPSLTSIVLRPGNHHVICQYNNPFIRRWVLYCLLWYSSLWWWKKYSFTCGANVDDHEKKLSFLVSCSFGNTKGMNWSKTAISDYCANVYKQVDDGFGKDTSSIFCHTMGNFNQKNEHLYRMQTSLFRKITVCPCYDNVLLYKNV